MSEPKFTKGKWAVKLVGEDYQIIDPLRMQHITIERCAINPDWEEAAIGHWLFDDNYFRDIGDAEQRANAYLIASAPEMYEILEMLYEMTPEDACHFIKTDDSIRNVLSKARGEL